MPDNTDLDERVLATLSDRAKLDSLLADRGMPTVRAVALAFDESAEDVSRCLGGVTDRRPTMNRIRDKLAEGLDLSRATIDGLLGGPLP